MPTLGIVALVVLVEGLCVGMTIPVMSYYAAELGGGAFWNGALFALTSGPRIFSNGLFGRWSDAIGRRPLMLVATLGGLLGSVGWALAPGLWWLAAARFVTGFFGVQATLAQAVAADTAPPEKRAVAVGVLGAAFGSAFAVAPLVGGVVGKAYGHAAVGWLCAGLQAISLTLMATRLRETRPADVRAAAPPRTPARTLLGRRSILDLLAVTLTTTLASMLLLSTCGVVAKDHYALDAGQNGILLGLVGAVGIVVQGGLLRPLVARFGERSLGFAGLLLMVFGFILFAELPPLRWLYFAAMLIGGGLALVTPVQTALLSRCVGPEEQGVLLGVNQSTNALGRTAGAILGAVLLKLGHAAPFWASAAACTVALGAFAGARARSLRSEFGAPTSAR